MIIQNYKQITKSKNRRQLAKLVEVGIEAVLPGSVMPKVIKFDKRRRILKIGKEKYELDRGRLFVVGGGKAAGEMAQMLEKIVGVENIEAGVVNSIEANKKVKKIKVNKASHPIPDRQGVKGVKQILELKKKFNIGRADLVLCLISGGGSALLPCPRKGITLADKQKVTQLLIESGAEIHEINVVRKHLSSVKGGQLAEYFSPAQVVSVIISDVVGNDLETIASGPTVADRSMWMDVYGVFKKYGLLNRVPKRVITLLGKGMDSEIPETPKLLTNADNYVIADNRVALQAIADKARGLGLNPLIITDKLEGETSYTAKNLAQEIKSGKYDGKLIILGGETTNRLPSRYGMGGRNQHFGAVSLLYLEDYEKPWTLLSLASDGSDFIKGIGGVMVDNKCKGEEINKYIQRFESYKLFKKIGECLIETSNSGTNVGDIIMYMID